MTNMISTPNRRFCLALVAPMALATACSPSVTSPLTLKVEAPQALVAPGPHTPDAVALQSAIRKVTVFSDRALVTRDAAAKATASPTVYAFKQLPGWVDEGSVRVATTVGRILDVRVARNYLALATDQTFQKAEADAAALGNRAEALDDELQVLDAKTKQIEDIKLFSLDKLKKDVLEAHVDVSTYGSVLTFITDSLRETAHARRSARQERAKLTPEIEASRKRVDELQGLTQLEETTVYVTLQGTPQGEGTLTLAYMLPGATWEPHHEVRAGESDPKSVEITSFAVVTQASGEDWDNAELTFSTQSSTAAVRIPELDALTLGETKERTQSVERQTASFTRAESAFKGQNKLWNKRLQTNQVNQSFEEVYQTNYESLQVTQSKTVAIFQSLQQRGTTAQFKGMSPATVRADGRSVQVPVGQAQLAAKPAIVAAPEQSLNAARTLIMRNEGQKPLLPGKVGLYQGGAFLGMTDIGFVAAGEEFSVFLSVADHLKIARVLDRKHSALMRKQRTQMQLAFVVTVENLSGAPVPLTLADRIPVSEDKEIVVSNVKITPDAKADSKGILRWNLTLAPKEQRRIEVNYQLEYPPTLVLETSRERAVADSPMKSAAPAPARDIRKDIRALEAGF